MIKSKKRLRDRRNRFFDAFVYFTIDCNTLSGACS